MEFVKMVAAPAPRDFNVSVSGVDDMTDDEIIARIRELNAELGQLLGGEPPDDDEGRRGIRG